MARRYFLPARVILRGDTRVASSYIGRARTILGELTERLVLSSVETGSASRSFPGVIIRVSQTPTTAVIEITASSSARSESVAKTDTALWFPAGFVVYPASDTAPNGWGLPVVPQHADIFNPLNLAPGLAPARWTVDGPLGQVLITRDIAYPDTNVTVPLLYSQDFGNQPESFPTPTLGAYNGYRIEFQPFEGTSQPSSLTENVLVKSYKRTVFDLVNQHRVSIGRDPLLLPVRGFFDSGQITTEVSNDTHVFAHYSDRFPYGLCTPGDRAHKEGVRTYVPVDDTADDRNVNFGIGENVVANVGADTVIIGTDPNGYPIRYVPTSGPDMTGSVAFTSWLASPPHRANIENSVWDGFDTYTEIGFKRNYAAQHFIKPDQWVGAGNRQFISAYANVPPVSWFGPSSLNLLWETWPCRYNNDEDNEDAPLFELGNIVSDDKLFWLRYSYGEAAGEKLITPAFENRIFVRGRPIAVAPHGGLIWAVGVQKLAGTPTLWRLLALVHHPDDQPDDTTQTGQTPYVRLWYCDIAERDSLPLNPQTTIRSVFGEEDTSFPWTVRNDVNSWRGGQLIDVGTSNGSSRDLLKYSAQWVFSADGTKAACARNFGDLSEYAFEFESMSMIYNIYSGPPASVIELDISTGAVPVATKNWLGKFEASDRHDYEVGDIQPWHLYMYVGAVGYTEDNVLKFAIHGDTINPNGPPINVPAASRSFFGYATDYTVATPEALSNLTYFSANLNSPIRPAFVPYLQIIDVLREVIIAVGYKQLYKFDGANNYVINDDREACWRNNASADIVNVRAWIAGEQVHSKWYPNPDNFVISVTEICYVISDPPGGGGSHGNIGVILPLSTNNSILPSFAQQRGGDYMLGYVFTPQPFINFWFNGAPGGTCDIIGVECNPTFYDITHAIALPESNLKCRGSWFSASFADEDALISMTGPTGPNARLLYARAV